MNRSGRRFAAMAAVCWLAWLAPVSPAGQTPAAAAELTGRLVAGDGTPAAEVPVYLHPCGDDTDVTVELTGRTGNDASLVRDYSINSKPAETTTGADGGFRFPDVPAGSYFLRIPRRTSGDDERFVEELEPMPLAVDEGPTDLGELRYRRCGAYVEGTVRIGGRPAGEAQVRRWSEGLGPMRNCCLSDGQGRFRLYIYDVPADGMEVRLVAEAPGRAVTAKDVTVAGPWSHATADFDLKPTPYGTVVGITRPIGREEVGGKLVEVHPPDPGAMVYFCPPGKGREESILEPVQLVEARFNALVPPGEWDMHLIRPGHSPIVQTVRVQPGRRVRAWFRAPAETPVTGRVVFTLDGQPLDYDLAASLAVNPVVQLLGGTKEAMAPVAEIGSAGGFSLAAPGKGAYEVQVHASVMTDYGLAVLQALGPGRQLRIEGDQIVTTRVTVDLMPILRARLTKALASGAVSRGAVLAELRWRLARAGRLAAAAGLERSAKALQTAMQKLIVEVAASEN